MAGVYGAINSRAGFHRVLREATELARQLQGSSPHEAAMARINQELDAIRSFTADGREPTETERSGVNVGVIALRMLPKEDETADLVGKLCILSNYLEDWPTDAQAAAATDDDFWNAD